MQVRCQVLPSGFEQRIPANRKIYSWLWRCAPISVSWQVQKPQSHGPSDGNISSHIQDNHSPAKIDWSAVRSRLQVEASGPESRPGIEHRTESSLWQPANAEERLFSVERTFL